MKSARPHGTERWRDSMERLTFRCKYDGSAMLKSGVSQSVLDRLAAYEDAEKQGLLVRLPCKVGDTVFRIWNGEIEQYQVVSVWYNDHIKRRFHAECFPFYRFYDEDIGKTVFLTREEAEAALAKDTNVPNKEG